MGENTENFITFSIKRLRKVKQSHTKWGLLTLLDLSDIHYNVLLIISGLHNYECINCTSCLNYVSTNDIQLIFKCMNIAKTIKSISDKDLIKRFENTYEFCNPHINKFILLSIWIRG